MSELNFYYILRTERSTSHSLEIEMMGEPVEASNKEEAIEKFVEEHEDLDAEKLVEAGCMEEQHYMALEPSELEWYGHPEKTAVHPILGR